MTETNTCSDFTCNILRFSEFSPGLLYELLKLRSAVFVVEQNCVYQDLDDLDQESVHLLLLDRGGRIAAACRLLPPSAERRWVRLGRLIASRDYRGLGLGKRLLAEAVRYASETWPAASLCLAGQAYLDHFYTEAGFRPISEIFYEDEIAHRLFVRGAAAPPLEINLAESAWQIRLGSEQLKFNNFAGLETNPANTDEQSKSHYSEVETLEHGKVLLLPAAGTVDDSIQAFCSLLVQLRPSLVLWPGRTEQFSLYLDFLTQLRGIDPESAYAGVVFDCFGAKKDLGARYSAEVHPLVCVLAFLEN